VALGAAEVAFGDTAFSSTGFEAQAAASTSAASGVNDLASREANLEGNLMELRDLKVS